jgi:hypothetical protein
MATNGDEDERGGLGERVLDPNARGSLQRGLERQRKWSSWMEHAVTDECLFEWTAPARTLAAVRWTRFLKPSRTAEGRGCGDRRRQLGGRGARGRRRRLACWLWFRWHPCRRLSSFRTMWPLVDRVRRAKLAGASKRQQVQVVEESEGEGMRAQPCRRRHTKAEVEVIEREEYGTLRSQLY